MCHTQWHTISEVEHSKMNEQQVPHSDQPEQIVPHSRMAKIVHWGFIAVFIYALTKQLDEVSQLEDFALLRFEMIFAIGFLALLAARFVYMRRTRPTALPENTPKFVKRAARAGHLAIYASLAMIALSGMMIGTLYWVGIKDGLLMAAVAEFHGASVMASYFAIGLHIAAAIFHRVLGDGIWSSMVPVFKETPKS